MSEVRLGDIIDDYCSRCGRLTDHSVAALLGNDVKKVQCRTCSWDHNYRHGKQPPKKKGKLSPYEQILASMNPRSTAEEEEAPRTRKKKP
jgi:hypothetical protein